jgi:uncharacterized phage protein (TIGR02220 family)
MREFAKVPPQFWFNANERKKLGCHAQLVAIYLLTSPHANMIGVYYLPVNFIAHETGMTMEEASKGLRGLIETQFCSYDDHSEFVWVHDMGFTQICTQLKPADNRVKAIQKMYLDLPKVSFLKAFYDKYVNVFLLKNRSECSQKLEAPSDTLRSKEKEKEKKKEKDKEKKDYLSGKPDDALFKNLIAKEKNLNSLRSQALQILQFLNEKAGRAYRPVETNLRLIEARLKSGITLCDCFQVIAKKTRQWKNDPRMMDYLRPATLFNATKFEQYVGELVVATDEDGAV